MTASILVVDDDADLRQTLQLLLDDSGYRVTAAASGQAALDQLSAGARPDLILLDLMMPDMNGWEFCKYRASSAALQKVPVIVITARRSIEAPAGASEILLKPFDPQILNDAIARALTPRDDATRKPGV